MKESKNRNVWIVVVIVLLAACLCAIVVAAVAATSWLGGFGWDWAWDSGTIGSEEQIDRTFEAGPSPELSIENRAGSVTVRAGERGEFRVVATKHASTARGLEQMEVRFEERDGGLQIKTGWPASLFNAWVKLEVTAPAGTYLNLQTGSGSVEVRGLQAGAVVSSGSGSLTLQDLSGEVNAHSGSGSVDVRGFEGSLEVDTGSGGIELEQVTGQVNASSGTGSLKVRDASGPVRLHTGSGSIEYQGTPEGECRFETGSGSIKLWLPADLNADLDLHTSSGSVDIGRLTVKGVVRQREVKGTIGQGGEASIYARTGSGSIDLIPR